MTVLADLQQVFEELKEEADEEEEFKLAGVSFIIGLLSREDEISAYEKAQEYSSSNHLVNSMALDVAKLAYAIRQVNDVKLPVSISDGDRKQARSKVLLKELMQMPSSLIEALTVKYNTANGRLREKLDLQTISFENFIGDLDKIQAEADKLDSMDDDELEEVLEEVPLDNTDAAESAKE